MSKYNIDRMTVREVMAVPELVAIIEKHIPGITRHPLLFMVKGRLMPDVIKMAGNHADPTKIRLMYEEAARL